MTAILNASGTAVVNYTYDAWGNPLAVTGTHATTLGTLNPLRYRGYVYDTETGFYYLQSRYYDPQIGRFLNADAYVSTGQGLLGNNMFAYCLNNPSSRVDIGGAASSVCYDDDEDGIDLIPGKDDVGPGGGGNPVNRAGSFSSNQYKNVSKEHNAFANKSSGTNKGNTVTQGLKPEVHHIVEQCQIEKSGFSEAEIQDKSNKVVIPRKLHQLISAHYSSIQEYSNKMRVRDWLAGQPFGTQYEYGMNMLKKFLEELYGIKID